MDVLLIVVAVIAIIAFATVLVFRSRRMANINGDDATKNENLISVIFESNNIAIPIEQLPATTQFEENRLFEIKESTIIARISQTIPAIAETATRTTANSVLKGMEVYRAIIPSGEALVKSKDMAGAVRGFSRGTKGIKSQANLVKVDVSKTTAVANGVANIMNIGSLVVGQYYMTEINSKLEEMNKSIDKISDFQNQEFKSRIFALIARIREISIFSSEIIDNDDFRNRKLQTLDDLKGECTQLLQQVNLAVDDEIKKNPKPDYKEYQLKIEDFIVLFEYQQMLLSVLEEISKLTYLLGKGESTNEMCYSIFNAYLKQSEQIRISLDVWHEKQVETLGIDIDKNRKSKKGIEGFFAAIPGFVDDKWNYKELKNGLGKKITAQKSNKELAIVEHENIYKKEVQIIIKDGKYYYLKGETHEHE